MPIPQYNVRQTDTGSRNYNQPAFRPAPAPPKVNPLKNWWNNIVNNARQTAFNPVNNWETVVPNVPTFNTSTQRTPWDIPYWTPPSVKTPLPKPTYSIFDPFGVPAYGVPQMPTAYGVPQMPTAYGTNTRRGSNTGLNARQMLLMQIYGTPAGEDYDQYDIGGPQQKYLNGVESLESLIARGAVDPNSHDPYGRRQPLSNWRWCKSRITALLSSVAVVAVDTVAVVAVDTVAVVVVVAAVVVWWRRKL